MWPPARPSERCAPPQAGPCLPQVHGMQELHPGQDKRGGFHQVRRRALPLRTTRAESMAGPRVAHHAAHRADCGVQQVPCTHQDRRQDDHHDGPTSRTVRFPKEQRLATDVRMRLADQKRRARACKKINKYIYIYI